MLVGLASCFSGIIGISGLVGIVMWAGLPSEVRQFDGRFCVVAAAAIAGWIGAWGLFRLAVKVWKQTDFRSYDPRDPDDRGIKW